MSVAPAPRFANRSCRLWVLSSTSTPWALCIVISSPRMCVLLCSARTSIKRCARSYHGAEKLFVGSTHRFRARRRRTPICACETALSFCCYIDGWRMRRCSTLRRRRIRPSRSPTSASARFVECLHLTLTENEIDLRFLLERT